jgi:hypothetical protein
MPIHELKLLREMQSILLQRTRVAENARNNSASQRIATEQTELHKLGAELLQRMQSQSQGGPQAPMQGRPEPSPPDPQEDPEQRNPEPAGAEDMDAPTSGTEATPNAA